MKIAIVSSKDIFNHPTMVMSATYWVNIKDGKLPFQKDRRGKYTCVSHTSKLNTATYLSEQEANELNVGIHEINKAKVKLKLIQRKLKLL